MRDLVVIDGDLVGYKAAAVNEHRTIRTISRHTGSVEECDIRTAFRPWLKTQEAAEEDFDIEDIQRERPVEYALHTAKSMIEKIRAGSKCADVKVVVQGDGNFRDNLPLPSRYKSGRDGMLRPKHLQAVQEYLMHKFEAEMAVNRESDDVLASYAYEGFKKNQRIVQATIDKDAKQCSGWLYNWDKHENPVFVRGLGKLVLNSKGDVDGFGRKWLYYQATVGDPSDTYKPTQLSKLKYGSKSAFNDFYHLTSDKECWARLVEIYKKWYPASFDYTAWNGERIQSDYLHMMQLYFDCAHMQRWDGDRICVSETL